MLQRVKEVQESDLRMDGALARNIQRVLPVTQADIDAAAALGKGWVVWKVVEVNDPIDNLRGGTQLVIKQNSITPGQNVRRVLIVSGPGGETVVIGPGPSPLLLPDAVANSLSYVKAFGGTEQRNLPDNYIERQFIYMMDGSYLLTDIVPTYDGRIEMDFQTTSFTSYASFLGGRSQTNQGAGLNFGYLNNVWIVDAFTTGSRYLSGVAPATNTRYKFIFDNQVATLTSGNSTLFTNTFTGTESNGLALVINGLNNNNSIVNNNNGIYLYSFKVWNGQGELVMDLVPAVQKGTVPVVGFYDTVSGTFKTATAGTFAAGPEAVPTPDTPMDIVCNNGVLKARHQSGLPLGYTLLDYIETDGNSYIDTNLLLSNTSEFEITFQSANATLNSPVMGAISGGTSYTSTDNLCVTYVVAGGLNDFAVYCDGNAGDPQCSWNGGNASDKLKHTIKYNGLNIAPTIDGVDMAQLTPTTLVANAPTVTTWLFGRNNTGSGTKTQTGVRIYDFKVDGVAHFVPCKNASNVIGMYDLVSGQFFTNAGTGDFTAGDPVSDPVEIYTDGTVETINAHGKNLFDQSTATRYRTSWSNGGDGAWQVVSSSSEAVTYGSYVKPNTTYTLSKKGGSRLIITGYRTKTEPSSSQSTPADYKIRTDTAEVIDGSYTFTTPADCTWILFGLRQNNSTPTFPYDVQLEQGSTATTYEPYYNGGTATTEMLLKVDDYQDVQSILDGVVTRNVGVKALDGTETGWTKLSGVNYVSLPKTAISNMASGTDATCLSNKFVQVPHSSISLSEECFTVGASYMNFKKAGDPTAAQFKQWLADQYAAGTPVIVIYPLATPTTESVAGQTLQVQAGDNTLTITQASLSGLELEAEYQKVA